MATYIFFHEESINTLHNLQQARATRAHERADGHVHVRGAALAAVEALLVAAQRDDLAQRLQVFVVLLLAHHRHVSVGRLVISGAVRSLVVRFGVRVADCCGGSRC